MNSTARRIVIALAALGGIGLLPGCGMDPPPAPGSAPAGETAIADTPAGTAPTVRTDLEVAKANGESSRCNIETLGGQSLEGVHPKIVAARMVPVLGWYAPAQVAAAPKPAVATAEGGPATDAAPAATAVASGPMLVIVSENGVKQWTVPLPALSERRDVAKAFNEPGLALSGFNVPLDLSSLNAGFYSLHLSDSTQSAESVCGLGRGFVIQ